MIPDMLDRPLIPERQAGPGIMVLSATRRLLYANRSACHLLKRCGRTEKPTVIDGVLPTVLRGLCDEVLQILQVRIQADCWDQVQARRLAQVEERSLLLQVFGLPDRQDAERSRIVITIQKGGDAESLDREKSSGPTRLTDCGLTKSGP